MRNLYFLFFTLLIFAFGNSQTIVTVDRASVTGPTDTGNDPSISSIGLTRGPGAVFRSATDFSTKNLTEASLVDALASDEYIEWSTTSSPSNSIEITGVDIRLRRNGNGPGNWQLFYSLDGFATAGLPVNSAQTLVANSDQIINISGLSINSGAATTITFRLYAWGAATNAGFLTVRRRASWAEFGIDLPGIRLNGNITTVTPNSIESNIVATAFDPTDNINYTLYSAGSGLTTTNAIKVGEFSIQDGGNDLTDPDALGTTLTDIEFGVSNADNISAIAIFDGTTNLGEVTSAGASVSFSGLSLTALDEGSKTFDVYATFETTVTDNDQFQLTVTSATADISSGSSFQTFDAGGAATPTTGDDNKIEVTASAFSFDQEPVDSFQFEIMMPAPVVFAVDINGNQDVDFNGTLSVVASGSLDPSLIDYTVSNGVSVLDSILFTEQETATTLIVFGGSFSPGVSAPFDINGPLITIAVQDFDGSLPEWSYSTDVATFDNGWGIDGYYGVIASESAAPLDYSLFSGNIFGENDLNDEGENGTSSFATLTLDPINLSNFDNVKLMFDWDVDGYTANGSDAQYRLIYDGVSQPLVFLLDGNGEIDSDEGTVIIDIPETVTTVSLQIRMRNNNVNGFSGFDNFKLVSVFEGLLYVDNGWTPNPPSDTTGSDNAYILNGTYNVGINIELNNLYVNEGATTTVSAGQSITTNAGLINNGTVIMNSVSTSYSSLISEVVRGEVVYNRHVNQFAPTGSTTGFNDLVSAPVTNDDQTFLALRSVNPDLPSGTIGGVPSFLFGPFDNDIDEYINFTAADDNTIIEAGVGYRTASTAPTGSTFRFEGDVETDTNLVPITVGNSSDFNLVGNPYPSYISLTAFLAANNSEFNPVTSGVYGYDGEFSDGFAIWNQAYADANPEAVITPGQGFLVSSKAGGGTITFTTDMRAIGTTDDFIPGRIMNPNLAFLKLELAKESGATFHTDLYFNDNATLGMDSGYDSAMFNETTPEFALFSHSVENNTGIDLAVQSVNYGALENIIIPLGVNANQGEQLTFSIYDTDIPVEYTIYLEDTVDNTFTLLNDSDYIFTPNTDLSGTGRFYLRLNNETLSTTDSEFDRIEIYTTARPSTLFVKGQLNVPTQLEMYDIQGRLVLRNDLNITRTSNEINIANFNSGVYLVKLSDGTQQRTQKVIIK